MRSDKKMYSEAPRVMHQTLKELFIHHPKFFSSSSAASSHHHSRVFLIPSHPTFSRIQQQRNQLSRCSLVDDLYRKFSAFSLRSTCNGIGWRNKKRSQESELKDFYPKRIKRISLHMKVGNLHLNLK